MVPRLYENQMVSRLHPQPRWFQDCTRTRGFQGQTSDGFKATLQPYSSRVALDSDGSKAVLGLDGSKDAPHPDGSEASPDP
jgi:hypothetical protein